MNIKSRNIDLEYYISLYIYTFSWFIFIILAAPNKNLQLILVLLTTLLHTFWNSPSFDKPRLKHKGYDTIHNYWRFRHHSYFSFKRRTWIMILAQAQNHIWEFEI